MPQEPTRLAYCESQSLILIPNRLYIFEVVEGCEKCEELVEKYDIAAVQREGYSNTHSTLK